MDAFLATLAILLQGFVEFCKAALAALEMMI